MPREPIDIVLVSDVGGLLGLPFLMGGDAILDLDVRILVSEPVLAIGRCFNIFGWSNAIDK